MEIQKAEKLTRKLDFISKLLLVLLVALAIVFIFFSDYINASFLSHPLSCFGFDFVTFFFSDLVRLLFIILPISAITIGFAVLFFTRVKKVRLEKPIMGINFWGLLVAVIFICLFMGMTLVSMCGCGSRYKARDAKRMSDLRKVSEAQSLFYQKYSRYADDQQEIINDGLLATDVVDPATGQEYVDADGVGVEGGDTDSQTWSVQVDLEGDKPLAAEICDKSRPKPATSSYYLCNEKECNTVHR